jgi:hypothetical protein
VVVTVIVNDFCCACESVTVTVQGPPAATGVTLMTRLGPVPLVGVTVATAAQAVALTANVPE